MGRGFTILIVDDDREILDLLSTALDEPRFTILKANDPFAAVRMLVERPVDLMITDIRMAELNGFELARQAKLMSPRLHVIYMSGYFNEVEQGRGPVYGV